MPTSQITRTSDVRWLGDSQFRVLHDGPDYDLTESVQPPGSQTPLHRHAQYEESLYVIAGSSEVWIDDRHATVQAGESITIPLGAVHTVRTGPEGAHAVVTSRPARFAGLIARTTTAEPAPPDLAAFAREGAAIGDELLGEPGDRP